MAPSELTKIVMDEEFLRGQGMDTASRAIDPRDFLTIDEPTATICTEEENADTYFQRSGDILRGALKIALERRRSTIPPPRRNSVMPASARPHYEHIEHNQELSNLVSLFYDGICDIPEGNAYTHYPLSGGHGLSASTFVEGRPLSHTKGTIPLNYRTVRIQSPKDLHNYPSSILDLKVNPAGYFIEFKMQGQDGKLLREFGPEYTAIKSALGAVYSDTGSRYGSLPLGLMFLDVFFDRAISTSASIVARRYADERFDLLVYDVSGDLSKYKMAMESLPSRGSSEIMDTSSQFTFEKSLKNGFSIKLENSKNMVSLRISGRCNKYFR